MKTQMENEGEVRAVMKTQEENEGRQGDYIENEANKRHPDYNSEQREQKQEKPRPSPDEVDNRPRQ